MALACDGYWGIDTTRALQAYFGLPQTGYVYHQWADNRQPALTSGWHWDYSQTGDVLICNLQSFLGTATDGLFGSNDIRALQRHMGCVQDGTLDVGSNTIKIMQRRLGNGIL